MGLIYTNIDLKNPRDSSLKPITVKALVDTEAVTLCIPEHVAVQLKLDELEKKSSQNRRWKIMSYSLCRSTPNQV